VDSLVNKKIKKFQNKVVVVTGASSGLGLNIAKEFIKENAKVSLCARRIDKLKKNYQNKKMFFFKRLMSQMKEIFENF
jgi:NADP-dependent 3-hydroxy acid dehydrogenase YdfG